MVRGMKNSYAHTDNGIAKNICLKGCCIQLEELTQILDIVSRVRKILELSPNCNINLRIFSRFDLCKNLSANIIGRFTALINLTKNVRINKDYDVCINTLCNLANDLVELRNIVNELLEDPGVADCNIAKDMLSKLILDIDRLSMKMLVIALVFLKTVEIIPPNLSGKIASSLASLLFASLLNIHHSDVKDDLKKCFFYDNISLQ